MANRSPIVSVGGFFRELPSGDTITSPNGSSAEQFGAGAAATGANSVAFGNAAAAGASGSIGVGSGASASTANSIAVGHSSSAGFAPSIAIGTSAASTAINQFVVGSSTAAYTDFYLGDGVTAAVPSGTTVQATGGSGTDIAGAALTIAGGKGTGAGTPGSLIFKTSDVLGTGTTLQTLATRLTITNVFDFDLPDNVANAFDVEQGTNEYISIDTTNSSELVTIGNAVTNPGFTVAGTGAVILANGTLDVPAGTSFKIGGVALGTANFTAANINTLLDGSNADSLHTHSVQDTFSFFVPNFLATDEVLPDAGAISDFSSLDFDPSTDNEVKIQFTVPNNINGSGNLTVKAKFAMSSANAGTVVITTEGSVNNSTTITASDTTIDPSDSAGVFESATIRSLSSLAADDEVVLKIKRDTADVSDTHTGDWRLLSIICEYSS